ncbi:MAG: glycosyltransferase [Eubacteriales bacterium]|nr:glycosyltransferase [Eubacteriales bacterium]
MNSKEKISIIVPVYNLQNELPRCVASIRKQTYSNLEIILVDDGSTDNSKKVIQALAGEDKRIIPVFKKNGGVTSARFAGCNQATGDWIGFVDGDDEIETDMYEFLLENALKYHAQISHCGYQMIFSDGRIHYFYNTGCLLEQDKITGLKELLSGERIEPGLCNKLFHRRLFDGLLHKNVIDESIKINEDLLMNYYLFKAADKTIYEDRCLYHYLIRDASASRKKLNQNRIYDPIKVKQIILDDAAGELKPAAEQAYLSTCIYTYCGLTLESGRLTGKDREQVRECIRRHGTYVERLPARMKILAKGIMKIPGAVNCMYPVYAGRFQKKKYN